MNGKIKVTPDKIIYPETDAGAVKYGNKILEKALDDLSDFEPSEFGQQLMSASKSEFFKLLEIAPDYFFDECQNYWTGSPFISDEQSKFGSTSLQLGTSRTTCSTTQTLTFGGDPFTVSFWAYFTGTPSTNPIFRANGVSRSFGLYYKRGSDNSGYSSYTVFCVDLYSGTTSPASIYKTENLADANAVKVTRNAWHHFELDYNGTSLRYFYDGTLKRNYTVNIPREGRKIYLGAFGGYIDELRILDGVCEHTAAFTPPTEPYERDENTIALLHFEG